MWSKLAAIDVKMVRVALGWITRDRVDWLLKGGTTGEKTQSRIG